jgi:hypothetical protein
MHLQIRPLRRRGKVLMLVCSCHSNEVDFAILDEHWHCFSQGSLVPNSGWQCILCPTPYSQKQEVFVFVESRMIWWIWKHDRGIASLCWYSRDDTLIFVLESVAKCCREKKS